VGSGVVALFVLIVLALLGFQLGYGGILLAVVLSGGVWIGGTVYATCALYREWDRPADGRLVIASSDSAEHDHDHDR
jgi:hypothetical protein